jgi:uncharacterized membrane protein
MMTLDRKLKLGVLVFSIIGLIDSLYLSWVKLSHTEAACLPGIGNCETVNSSSYASIFGIPIALLGAGAYAAIILVLYLEQRKGFWADNGQLAVFGVSLIGLLYSAYLTYIELAVLHAVCPYCVISAFAMLFVFIFNLTRLIKKQA